MDKMTFHESYGEVSAPVLRLIKTHNVSPADFNSLSSVYGNDWRSIERTLKDKRFHIGNSFSEFRWQQSLWH